MFVLLLACYAPSTPSNSHVLTAPDLGEDPYTGGDTDEPAADDTGGDPDDPDADIPADITPPAITINEVMPKNGFTLNLAGSYPDWIELYNGTPETVTGDRITLTDGSGRVYMGEPDDVLLPGGFLLVYADGVSADLHAPFTLSANGDNLTLAVDGYVVDRLATGEMDADVSWARFPDGGDWAPTIWTTAGESNGSTPSDDLDTNATMFGLYGVHQVAVDIDSSGISSLTSSPTTYVESVVTVDSAELDPVGVRLRGSSTYRDINSKCSMKVDTNRFEDLTFRGKRKFHLINMVWDAAHVREYISYYIFREFGVPSVRNSYAWVQLNGRDKGLYMFSEVYDDEFLKDWYGNNDGYLWEPGSGDFTSASGWECEDGACDTSVISPIASLLRSTASDSNVAAMEDVLDLDNVLREIAVEIAVNQWDGYCSPHNYRVYYDPQTGLSSIMPSSVDLTFDNLGYNYGHNYFSCNGSVLAWCLSNNGCEAHYIDILNELADGIEGDDPATDLGVQATLSEIETLIDPYQTDDAGTGLSGFTYAQSIEQFEYIRQYLIDEPERIRDQIASH